MWDKIAVLLVCLASLAWFADRLVLAAINVAKRTTLPPLWIGIVLVGLVTTLPECLVSFAAIRHQHIDISIGNILGSYIANIGLVLGVTACLIPLPIRVSLLRRELPVLTVAYALVLLCFANGVLGRWDGVVLLFALVAVVVLITYWVLKEPKAKAWQAEVSSVPDLSPLWIGVWLVLGSGGLYISAKGLVWSAAAIAQWWGLSDMVIGVTIVAVGTSLPELAASLASARHGHYDVAVGNVIGSNIFGLLGVLALPALLAPGPVAWDIIGRDVLAMGVMTALLWLTTISVKGRKAMIHRWEGAVLVLVFISYLVWSVIT